MNTVRSFAERILELPTKFFVDIGASDNPYESQTELLIENGWSGIMFECDPVKFRGVSSRLAGKSVTVLPTKVTPDNIAQLLKENNAPNDFFLSLDIDGYDYFVLNAILENFAPQFIISEINEKIPPPMKFSVLYEPKYWWGGSHFYGYSIGMLEDLLPAHGYKIDCLDYNNVILVPGTQEKSLQDIYNEGYFTKPDRQSRFYYNEDFEPIYSMSYDEQVKFVRTKFSKYEGRYSIDGGVCIENTGQIQLSQPFGQWIAKYAADPRFTRYLEIGTWNGRGSTCCLYDGFIKRSDSPSLQSYEIHGVRAAEARALWTNAESIQVIHGRVLPDSQCPTYREVKTRFPALTEDWHSEDIRNFWSCPYVAPNDPEVVLLDGAEYLTQFEFERVFRDMPGIRVFLLDDTHTAKTPLIYSYLLEHPEWRRVAYSDVERHGWAVFERITSSSEQTPETPADQE